MVVAVTWDQNQPFTLFRYYSSRALPVGGEAAEGRGRVAGAVQVVHRAGRAALGHHLLVLVGGAPEGFPHVDVLQRH